MVEIPMPLISRTGQFPPGFYQFFEPKTGWSTPGTNGFYPTRDEIVTHRLANPRFEGQWNTDPDAVANELDNYTCLRINNDVNYCNSGAPPNFPQGFLSQRPMRNPSQNRVASVGHAEKTVAGIGLLIDWLGSGLKPVEKELAERRASVCVECPLNQEGNFWVRIEAWMARKIKTCLAIRADMNLSTKYDDRLHSCSACDCDLKLKSSTPIEHIKAHTSDAVKVELAKGKNCWVLEEMK